MTPSLPRALLVGAAALSVGGPAGAQARWQELEIAHLSLPATRSQAFDVVAEALTADGHVLHLQDRMQGTLECEGHRLELLARGTGGPPDYVFRATVQPAGEFAEVVLWVLTRVEEGTPPRTGGRFAEPPGCAGLEGCQALRAVRSRLHLLATRLQPAH